MCRKNPLCCCEKSILGADSLTETALPVGRKNPSHSGCMPKKPLRSMRVKYLHTLLNVYTIERLDQGHLHPLLAHPDTNIPPVVITRVAVLQVSSLQRAIKIAYSKPLHGFPSACNHHTWINTKSATSNVGFQLTAFTRIAIAGDAPGISCLNHVGVTTMKKLDQEHLHPLLQHPKTDKQALTENQTWVACVAGESFSKEQFEHFFCCFSEPLQYSTDEIL